MKPGRPIRQQLEQSHNSAAPLGRRDAEPRAAEATINRHALAGGAAPGSGWRLPSGQLLVEYALQTCFTGSPLARPAFAAGAKEPDGGESAALDTQAGISQQLNNLSGALGGPTTAPASRRAKRTAAPPAAKRPRAAGKDLANQDLATKERARS